MPITKASSNAVAPAAKGDLVVGNATNDSGVLAVGSTDQVLTVDSTTATGLKWASAAGGGGKVLQVVSATTTTSTEIASTSLTDTGITLNITPSSATSKVLVIVSAQYENYRDTSEANAGAKLLRGATTLLDYSVGGNNNFSRIYTGGSNSINIVTASLTYLDSPASTSALTYKLQSAVASTANGGKITFQKNSAPSTITLLEIGA
jgi:hypothetical protein